MTVEITVLLAVLSTFAAVSGFFAARDKKITGESEWRGRINKSLDDIERKADSICITVSALSGKIEEHSERIAKVESSAKQAHLRIDKIEGGIRK